jgi:hypothetical protein
MKNVFIPTLVLAVGFACQAAAFASDKPPKSTTPLGADELAIYKAIVPQQSVKNSGVVNVSNTTLPLRSNSPLSGLSRKACMQGIELDNLFEVDSTFHDLPPDVVLDTA